MTEALKPFPDEWSCTAWEDCAHDGICHDPKNCGAIGPNHHAFYGISDDKAATEPDLTDPATVHLNMLRGTIAKPTLEQIIHLYGVDALCKALVPIIVREAEANKEPPK